MEIIGICKRCFKKLYEGKSKKKDICNWCDVYGQETTYYLLTRIKKRKSIVTKFYNKEVAEHFKEMYEKKGFVCKLQTKYC